MRFLIVDAVLQPRGRAVSSWDRRRFTKVGEDSVDDGRLGVTDEGQNLHLDRAMGTAKGIDFKDEAEELRPSAPALLDVGWGTFPGNRARTPLILSPSFGPSPNGVNPKIPHHVGSLGRDLEGEKRQEGQGIVSSHDGAGAVSLLGASDGDLPGIRVVVDPFC